MFVKLLILFILVPLAELYLFLSLGRQIGLGPTFAIIILTAILGAALTRSQGRQALANFQNALAQGKPPHREATDGLLILIAGAVLLTPGFLTDTVGFLLLAPPIRALIRNRLAQSLKTRFPFPSQPQTEPQKPPSKLDDGNVIDV